MNELGFDVNLKGSRKMEIDGGEKLEHGMEKRDCRNAGYLDVHGTGGEQRRIGERVEANLKF